MWLSIKEIWNENINIGSKTNQNCLAFETTLNNFTYRDIQGCFEWKWSTAHEIWVNTQLKDWALMCYDLVALLGSESRVFPHFWIGPELFSVIWGSNKQMCTRTSTLNMIRHFFNHCGMKTRFDKQNSSNWNNPQTHTRKTIPHVLNCPL